jgi:hypothetical protein
MGTIGQLEHFKSKPGERQRKYGFVQEFVRKNAATFTASAKAGVTVCGCSQPTNPTFDNVRWNR